MRTIARLLWPRIQEESSLTSVSVVDTALRYTDSLLLQQFVQWFRNKSKPNIQVPVARVSGFGQRMKSRGSRLADWQAYQKCLWDPKDLSTIAEQEYERLGMDKAAIGKRGVKVRSDIARKAMASATPEELKKVADFLENRPDRVPEELTVAERREYVFFRSFIIQSYGIQ